MYKCSVIRMIKVISMVSKQRLSLIIFVTIGMTLGCVNYSYSMNSDRDDRGLFDAFFRMGSNPPKGLQDLMMANNLSSAIDKAEKALVDLEAPGANDEEVRAQRQMLQRLREGRDGLLAAQDLNVEDIKKINSEIRKLEGELRDMVAHADPAGPDRVQAQVQTIQALKRQRDKYFGVQSSSAKFGTLIARGLGGKTWDSLGFQQDVEGFSDGIQKGLIVRITDAFGDVVASKVKATIELLLGGTWDFFLLRTIDMWDDVCNIMFHDSRDPFKHSEVEGWQKLIIESMKQVEKNVKEGPKDNFRGQDMTLRSFGGEEKQLDFDENSASLSAWRMYVLGCVEQFEYFIQLIEKRKKYYKEDKLIVFYAEQIQSRLSDYKELMLKAKSVKDFDDYIESNKSLLPAMRENVEQLFKRLAEEAKPRTVFSGNSGSIRPTEVSRQRQSNDDDMPNRFSNGWGG